MAPCSVIFFPSTMVLSLSPVDNFPCSTGLALSSSLAPESRCCGSEASFTDSVLGSVHPWGPEASAIPTAPPGESGPGLPSPDQMFGKVARLQQGKLPFIQLRWCKYFQSPFLRVLFTRKARITGDLGISVTWALHCSLQNGGPSASVATDLLGTWDSPLASLSYVPTLVLQTRKSVMTISALKNRTESKPEAKCCRS
jgi:hypothetical protein